MEHWKILFQKYRNPDSYVKKTKLELLIQISNVNSGDMEVTALNFFTINELLVIKVLMQKTFESEFLPYFTRDNVFRNRNHLKFFMRKIFLRSKHFKPKSNFMKVSFKKLKKGIILKLFKLLHAKPDLDDPKYTRLKLKDFIRKSNLSKYFKGMQMIGLKFTNRRELDQSNEYCLKLVQNRV